MLEQLIKLVDENETISFDIFDTLLFRNVYLPTDIFKIIEIKLKEKFGTEDFFNLRIKELAKYNIISGL